MTKDELRRLALTVRAAAAATDPQAATRLAEHWPAALRPARLALYRAFRGELDPWGIADRLHVPTALPVTPPRGSDAPLGFRAWRPGEALVRSVFGVMEPGEDAVGVIPDVVLTPLLAFDRRGGRLGWGQGHFDRTLASLRARGAVVAVGVAYAAQARDDLPLEPHDQPLDGILTETGYIPVREVF